jgi:hypothetical protein
MDILELTKGLAAAGWVPKEAHDSRRDCPCFECFLKYDCEEEKDNA